MGRRKEVPTPGDSILLPMSQARANQVASNWEKVFQAHNCPLPLCNIQTFARGAVTVIPPTPSPHNLSTPPSSRIAQLNCALPSPFQQLFPRWPWDYKRGTVSS